MAAAAERAVSGRHRALMPVRCQPVPSVEVALGGAPARVPLPYPLEEPGTVFTYSGTSALYQAFRALKLAAGSKVLCPSYNCGHEIEPLLRLGLDPVCYTVTRNLEIDLEDVERGLRRGAKALLVTHYFGFPQPLAPLRSLCSRYGAFLVEDCAHALFSDNAQRDLGRVGDAAVYSMRKTLPLPHGGALVLNNPDLRTGGALRAPPPLSTWLKLAELVAKSTLDRFKAQKSVRDLAWLTAMLPFVAGNRALAALHPRARTACYNPDDESYAFPIEVMSWRMSNYSARLMRRLDTADIPGRRRTNYCMLLAALRDVRGCEPLFPELPAHVCPLYLPVRIDKPIDEYYRLAARRIFADVFWTQEHPAVDWSRFPEARELKQHVLALPVHQDIDTVQIERLAAALQS